MNEINLHTRNTFAKAQVQDIPLLWCAPQQDTPRHLVIWLPGFSSTKEAVQPYLTDLAARGFVALSFDPYQHGERQIETLDALRARVRSNIRRHFWPILARTTQEVPRVVDWAMQELGVDDRIGLGGISMGGDISLAAAGIEPRIAAVAAGIATADWLRPSSFEPPGTPDEEAQAAYDTYNPLTHLPRYRHCPAITIQCGANDRQVPPDGAQRFAEALQDAYRNTPERLQVTLQPETGHQFTPQMWQNVLAWFQQYLA